MVSSFSWTGAGSGVWTDPDNWTDVTATPTPAVTPPASGDSVTLTGDTDSPLVVTGPGQADSLGLSEQVALSGTFNLGTLTQTGSLVVLVGSVIAGTATISGAVDEQVGGMLVGTLTVDGGTLMVEPGAWVEVGTAGSADGTYGLVVDAGSTLTGIDGASLLPGSVLNNGTIAGDFTPAYSLDGINTGLISGISLDGMENDGTFATGIDTSILVGSLTSTGTIDISAGGTLEIQQGVTGTVTFAGDGGTLTVDQTGLANDALAVQGFASGDLIRIGGGITAASFSPSGAGSGTLTATTASGTFTMPIQGSYDSAPQVVLQDGAVTVSLSLPCFAAGTRIMTRRGKVPVEKLRVGDEVATLLSQGFRPVRWLGHRTIRVADHPRPHDILPVRIPAGAFAAGVPSHDLYLSPDHAVFSDLVLIPVKHLIGHGAITQIDVESIIYWHVELDRHDVLMAEGLPAESYLDTGDRASFANGGPVARLYPKFGTLTRDAEGCAPLVVTGMALERLRASLDSRARRLLRRRPAA
jgi:hypothetical protein